MWGEIVGSCEGLDVTAAGARVWETGRDLITPRRNCGLVELGGAYVVFVLASCCYE